MHATVTTLRTGISDIQSSACDSVVQIISIDKGGLNETIPYRFMYLNTCSSVGGSVWRGHRTFNMQNFAGGSTSPGKDFERF